MLSLREPMICPISQAPIRYGIKFVGENTWYEVFSIFQYLNNRLDNMSPCTRKLWEEIDGVAFINSIDNDLSEYNHEDLVENIRLLLNDCSRQISQFLSLFNFIPEDVILNPPEVLPQILRQEEVGMQRPYLRIALENLSWLSRRIAGATLLHEITLFEPQQLLLLPAPAREEDLSLALAPATVIALISCLYNYQQVSNYFRQMLATENRVPQNEIPPVRVEVVEPEEQPEQEPANLNGCFNRVKKVLSYLFCPVEVELPEANNNLNPRQNFL